MISTLYMQSPGIRMDYNELTDRSIVGILNIMRKTGGYLKVIAIGATRHLRFR